MNRLKEKWGVKSNWQFVIIFIVFAVTGSTSAYITKPILTYMGITKEAFHPLIYWPIAILLILPVYKILLVVIGTLLGQHKFFWNFVKNMLIKMRILKNK